MLRSCAVNITLPLTEQFDETIEVELMMSGRDSPLDPLDVLAVLMRCQAGGRNSAPAPAPKQAAADVR
ncbi:hypothetical protein BaRGS_00012447, partial [Batillaria attramentaria]